MKWAMLAWFMFILGCALINLFAIPILLSQSSFIVTVLNAPVVGGASVYALQGIYLLVGKRQIAT